MIFFQDFNTGICFTVCCNQHKLCPGLSPFSFIFLEELVRVLVFVMRKGHKWEFPLWNFCSNCQWFVDLMTMFFHRSKYTMCLPNQKRHKPTLTMFLKITVECGGGLWQRMMKAVQSASWSELGVCWLNCYPAFRVTLWLIYSVSTSILAPEGPPFHVLEACSISAHTLISQYITIRCLDRGHG